MGWSKMLTVCIDLAYPKERLLESQCDVGTGAAKPLRCLLPRAGPADNVQALAALLKIINGSQSSGSKHFWKVLAEVENLVRSKFKALPLVGAQANTKAGGMSAVTLQVQLCEYRQFRHFLARNRYGLPDDESMRVDPERAVRLHPDDFIEFNKKRKCVSFQCPSHGKKNIFLEVPIKATGGNRRMAATVAEMCFYKLQNGSSKEEVQKFRDEVLNDFRGGKDVSDDSEAWRVCKMDIAHKNPLVSFIWEAKNGSKVRFQTTAGAAGGLLEAGRIARLCWKRFAAGAKKEEVLAYRGTLYNKRCAGGGWDNELLQKRRRVLMAGG